MYIYIYIYICYPCNPDIPFESLYALFIVFRIYTYIYIHVYTYIYIYIYTYIVISLTEAPCLVCRSRKNNK